MEKLVGWYERLLNDGIQPHSSENLIHRKKRKLINMYFFDLVCWRRIFLFQNWIHLSCWPHIFLQQKQNKNSSVVRAPYGHHRAHGFESHSMPGKKISLVGYNCIRLFPHTVLAREQHLCELTKKKMSTYKTALFHVSNQDIFESTRDENGLLFPKTASGQSHCLTLVLPRTAAHSLPSVLGMFWRYFNSTPFKSYQDYAWAWTN